MKAIFTTRSLKPKHAKCRRIALLGCAVLLVTMGVGPRLAAQSFPQEARALQEHYGRLRSLKARFRQTYEANSVRQEESGTLWLLKPGKMRWDYHLPEPKLFLSDGNSTYFYVPSAHQVSIRKISEQDLNYTPFGFLIGRGDLVRDFELSALPLPADTGPGIRGLSLTPQRPLENVTSMELEYRYPAMEIKALTIHEFSGGTSRFDFSGLEENPRLADDIFRFKTPKGTEVIRVQ